MIVKEIRTNQMVGYIMERHPEVKVLFTVRHPLAVAYSSIKLGWKVSAEKLFLSQKELVKNHLKPYEKLIKEINDPFEQYVTGLVRRYSCGD